LSAGAFSDENAVKACAKIICVFVDCDWGKKTSDLSDKYKVEGYPTVIFTDSDGKQIEELNDREAEGLIKQVNAIAEKYTRGAAMLESWDKAAEKAKEEKKPVLYFFTTAKDDSKKLEEALGDDSLKELREKFILVKSEIKKDGADAKKFQVASSTQPVLLVLDPGAEKPEAKPLKKLSGKHTAKELKAELESALKKWDESRK
jgi:hypothetical protein